MVSPKMKTSTIAYFFDVVLAEDNKRKLEETVDDFLKDLQKDGISSNYSKQIKNGGIIATELQSAMAKNAIEKISHFHGYQWMASEGKNRGNQGQSQLHVCFP